MMISQPTGTKDFNAQDCRIRRKIFNKLIDVAETFAFQPLETPAIERIETMQGKYGEEGEKLFFKILKRGEQEINAAYFIFQGDDEKQSNQFFLKGIKENKATQ